jgi:hypothetical protein
MNAATSLHSTSPSPGNYSNGTPTKHPWWAAAGVLVVCALAVAAAVVHVSKPPMEPRARGFWPMFKLSAPVQEIKGAQAPQGVQEAPASAAAVPSSAQPWLRSAPKP